MAALVAFEYFASRMRVAPPTLVLLLAMPSARVLIASTCDRLVQEHALTTEQSILKCACYSRLVTLLWLCVS